MAQTLGLEKVGPAPDMEPDDNMLDCICAGCMAELAPCSMGLHAGSFIAHQAT